MKEIKSKVFNTECQILIQINKEATFGLEKPIFGFVGPGLSRTDNYLLTDPLIIDLVWDTGAGRPPPEQTPTICKVSTTNKIDYENFALLTPQARDEDPVISSLLI